MVPSDVVEGCCVVLRGSTSTELARVKRVMRQFLVVKIHAEFEKAFLLDESAQVDNFIVPDYQKHISTLSLSPFLEVSLPEQKVIEAIDADFSMTKDDVTDIARGASNSARSEILPVIITTSMKKDVNVRNMLADTRASSNRVRMNKPPKLQSHSSSLPKIYDILNKPVPMCFSSYLSNSVSAEKCLFYNLYTMHFLLGRRWIQILHQAMGFNHEFIPLHRCASR